MIVGMSFSLAWSSHPVMEVQASSLFLGQIKFYVHIVWRNIYDRIIRTSRPLSYLLWVAVCSPKALWLGAMDNELWAVGRVVRALCDLQWRGMFLVCTVRMLRDYGAGRQIVKWWMSQACAFCLVLHPDLGASWVTWTFVSEVLRRRWLIEQAYGFGVLTQKVSGICMMEGSAAGRPDEPTGMNKPCSSVAGLEEDSVCL